MILKESRTSNTPISKLGSDLNLITQINKDITINKKQPSTETLELVESLASNKLNQGRVIIRASGTEPVIRVLIESNDNEKNHEVINFIEKEITKHLS